MIFKDLAVLSFVAVPAFPDTLPVTSPVRFPENVAFIVVGNLIEVAADPPSKFTPVLVLVPSVVVRDTDVLSFDDVSAFPVTFPVKFPTNSEEYVLPIILAAPLTIRSFKLAIYEIRILFHF